MNNKQIIISVIVLIIVLFSAAMWAGSGFEIFTKTQVLVELKDKLFDTTYKQWIDKFVWGLDLSLAISGGTVILGGISIYFLRNKKKRQ